MAEITEITKVQELVYELKIEQVMTRSVVTVPPETTMRALKEILRLRRISGVPVVDRDRLVGIVSIEDLIKALEKQEADATVGEKMSLRLITVLGKESVIEAVKLFKQHGIGRLPVVDAQGQLVGILTGGDIIRGLLEAIGVGYQEEEISRYRASHIFDDIVSDQTSLILCYKVPKLDFSRGGEASSKIKRALFRLGADPNVIRRVAIATYEAEMNLIIHSDQGGDIVAEIRPELVRILAIDTGPGIADLELAQQAGYSTAPDWIRELGFGAGMGLMNIKRCADTMKLESEPGIGTRLEIFFSIPGPTAPREPADQAANPVAAPTLQSF